VFQRTRRQIWRAALGACALIAYAQPEAPAACRKYEAIPTPQSAASPAAKCDSESLYYGFDHPPDPAKARECAYRELGKHDPGNPISGEAILAMIYANGTAVPRNLDLALKFACEIDGAPAEMDGRIAHLEKLRAEGWTGSNFDVCDDITSGYMEGFCAYKDDRLANAVRERKLSAITDRWTPAERGAFAPLRDAAKKFFTAHSAYEIDLSGSGRVAFEIEANAKLEDAFISDLERFERGDLPHAGATLSTADAELNSVYAKLMQPAKSRMDTIKPKASAKPSASGSPTVTVGPSSAPPSIPPRPPAIGNNGALNSACNS
jgi:hypothetical protein